MGFLSAIFKVFFPSGSRSTKPEKSERDYDLEEWERNKKLLTKASRVSALVRNNRRPLLRSVRDC